MIETAPDGLDAYAAAVELAGAYRVDLWTVYDELRRLYGTEDISAIHLSDLARQVERSAGEYEKKEEREELKRELDARPDEDRPVTVVCLGIEIAAQAWVDEWNALRRGAAAVNKIQVIELRSDPKYGKFIRHEPARAKVKIDRKQDKILVEIQDFISPTIVERLQQQAGVLSPKIDDWRAMVDCVMIDPSYDGSVFNVVLSDVPERKTDLVEGR